MAPGASADHPKRWPPALCSTRPMRSAEISEGRRIVVVLDPGDEVIESIQEACREHGIRSGTLPVFLGAFTSVTLIGTREAVVDPEAPMPQRTVVRWVEGSGSGTVASDETGTPLVHLHASVGDKADAALGYAGHVIAAVTHYTAELVIEEILEPQLIRQADPSAHGLATLRFRW